MKYITIIGLGLIGGSIARALTAAQPDIVIHGVDPSDASRALMEEDDVVTSTHPQLTQAAIERSDTIIIATPPQYDAMGQCHSKSLY